MFFVAVIPPYLAGRSDEGACDNALPEARRRRRHQSQQARRRQSQVPQGVRHGAAA